MRMRMMRMMRLIGIRVLKVGRHQSFKEKEMTLKTSASLHRQQSNASWTMFVPGAPMPTPCATL
jgi:hypothetical protein